MKSTLNQAYASTGVDTRVAVPGGSQDSNHAGTQEIARGATLTRRTALAGAVVAGAAAAVAVANSTPKANAVQQVASPADAPVPVEEGYRLTEHIKRYYATART